jgi:hypothetical protein
MPDRVIELLVSEAGADPEARFGWHVRLDGQVVAANLSLTPVQSREVRELAWRYGQLFERRTLPQLAREAQAGLGSALFALWLAPAWSALSAKLGLGDQRTVLIRSASPAILNLPWELLRTGGEPLGSDARWALRRVPIIEGAVESGPAVSELPPGPLRVLLMVAAPQPRRRISWNSTSSARRNSSCAHWVVTAATWWSTPAIWAALPS